MSWSIIVQVTIEGMCMYHRLEGDVEVKTLSLWSHWVSLITIWAASGQDPCLGLSYTPALARPCQLARVSSQLTEMCAEEVTALSQCDLYHSEVVAGVGLCHTENRKWDVTVLTCPAQHPSWVTQSHSHTAPARQSLCDGPLLYMSRTGSH